MFIQLMIIVYGWVDSQLQQLQNKITIISQSMLNEYMSPNLQESDFVGLGKIGKGSFSEVLKVRNINDGKIYALKKIKMGALKPKQQQYAINQIKILASIQSPYIISYKWSFYDRNSQNLCIIMEWANEGDLQAEIDHRRKKREGEIPESQIWRAIHDLLIGLNLLHSKCVMHRDIKTANIFKSEGVYKIGDLNIAKICPSMIACTQTGTPYYASPQVWNQKPYNDKSDVWSLGCVIYEMCEMQPPFVGANMQRLFQSINRGKYRPISTKYSQGLQRFIDKCLKVNVRERYSCRELLNNEEVLYKLKSYKIIDKQPLFISPQMPQIQKNSQHNNNNHSNHSNNNNNNNNNNHSNVNKINKPTPPTNQISNQNNNEDNRTLPQIFDQQKKKYRLLIKNKVEGCGVRPRRNLKTSRSKTNENQDIVKANSNRCYTNQYNRQASAKKQQQQRPSNTCNRKIGVIKSIARASSASKAQQYKKYKYRIASSSHNYSSLKGLKKIQARKNYTLSSQNNKIVQNSNYIQHQKNQIIQTTKKHMDDSDAKQNDILKKLKSDHQQRYNKPVSMHISSSIHRQIKRPLTSQYLSNISEDKQNSLNTSSYKQITSKQQLRKDVNKNSRYQAMGNRSYLSRPNSNYAHHSQNNLVSSNQYMASILNKIRR